MKITPKIRAMLEEAYLAGFCATGEVYNIEYPFKDGTVDPRTDSYWLEERDEALQKVMEGTPVDTRMGT